jgi:hypothetical protein
MEGLKAFFRANDFSTMTSNYKPNKATNEQNNTYLRAKGFFRSAWDAEMKKMLSKGSLINFSKDSPIRCLGESEEDLVAGTVMELLQKEDHCIALMDQILEDMKEPIMVERQKYATARGKTSKELTDEEFRQAFEAFADEFLSRMMKLLQQVQEVPVLLDFMHCMPAEEDFDRTVFNNYQKIDFERQWAHSRTEIGAMLELTPEMIRRVPGDPNATAKEALDLGLLPADTEQELSQLILNAFIASLKDEVDREIMYMRADGKTQAEIATALGYASHSAVTKRMKELKKQFHIFMAQINGT